MTLDTLMRQLWPGGVGDRFDAPGAEWLRRWGPARQTAEPPAGASSN